VNWEEIPGWFRWRSAQEDAAHRFPDGSRFVEVGNFLGRSWARSSSKPAKALPSSALTRVGVAALKARAPPLMPDGK